MYLLIDAGNSRIKWLYGNTVPGIVEAASYKEDWRTKLWRAWHLLPEPHRIAISCVNNTHIENEVAAIVDDLWGKPLQIFIAQKETNHTLTVAYEEAHTLGSDRYLAMLGARGLTHEPLCVVGCGTAITLDVVDGEGRHSGGLI
ncbi:MAG: type III pantothenate kinase, partial [Cardiobacteriaceae bacterium]|nr:type III pantothenate kinase [Cardiobacteriaceae bacterium]